MQFFVPDLSVDVVPHFLLVHFAACLFLIDECPLEELQFCLCDWFHPVGDDY